MSDTCPYCGSSFGCDPDETLQKHPELSKRDETEWMNKCSACEKWILYKDNIGIFKLQDPSDPHSAEGDFHVEN